MLLLEGWGRVLASSTRVAGPGDVLDFSRKTVSNKTEEARDQVQLTALTIY